MVSNLFSEIGEIRGPAPSLLLDRPAHDLSPKWPFRISNSVQPPLCVQLPRCEKENLEPVIELAVEIAGKILTPSTASMAAANKRRSVFDFGKIARRTGAPDALAGHFANPFH